MALKACSACGRVHDKKYRCPQSKRIDFKHKDNVRIRSGQKWQDKATDIKERSNYLCAVCRAHGKLVYDGLEVHHIIPVKDDNALTFDDGNLVCLCQSCHEKAEHGLISKEELVELARIRDMDTGIPPIMFM